MPNAGLLCFVLVVTLLAYVECFHVNSISRIRKRCLAVHCKPGLNEYGKDGIRKAMMDARKSQESGLSPGAQMVRVVMITMLCLATPPPHEPVYILPFYLFAS